MTTMGMVTMRTIVQHRLPEHRTLFVCPSNRINYFSYNGSSDIARLYHICARSVNLHKITIILAFAHQNCQWQQVFRASTIIQATCKYPLSHIHSHSSTFTLSHSRTHTHTTKYIHTWCTHGALMNNCCANENQCGWLLQLKYTMCIFRLMLLFRVFRCCRCCYWYCWH